MSDLRRNDIEDFRTDGPENSTPISQGDGSVEMGAKNIEDLETAAGDGKTPVSQPDGSIAMSVLDTSTDLQLIDAQQQSDLPAPGSVSKPTFAFVHDLGKFLFYNFVTGRWYDLVTGNEEDLNYVDIPNDVANNIYMGFGDGDKIASFDLDTGNENWSTLTNSGAITTAVSYYDGKLYYSGEWDNLVAMDPSNGNELWKFTTMNRTYSSSPTVISESDRVYIADEVDIIAVDAQDGTEIWRYDGLFDPDENTVAVGPNGLYASSTTNTGNTVKIDRDGNEVWTTSEWGSGNASARPLVLDGQVYITGISSGYAALDETNGNEIWSYPTSTPSATAAIADGSVYLVDGPDLISLDASDGSENWRYTAGVDFGASSSPAVVNGVVYAVTDTTDSGTDEMVAVNASDGSEKWVYHESEGWGSPVAVKGEYAIAGTDAGTLRAINTSDGTEAWYHANLAQYIGGNVVPIGAGDGTSLSNRPGRIGNSTPIKPWW